MKGKEYHSLEGVTEALLKREVQGILVDAYSAGLRNDLFSKFKVSEIVDYKTAYGIVLSPRSTSLRKCFHRYLQSHRAELFKMIESKVRPIQVCLLFFFFNFQSRDHVTSIHIGLLKNSWGKVKFPSNPNEKNLSKCNKTIIPAVALVGYDIGYIILL